MFDTYVSLDTGYVGVLADYSDSPMLTYKLPGIAT
jgi:hypothetical protein